MRSFFFSGAGQLYNGQRIKGILLIPISSAFYLLTLYVLLAASNVYQFGPEDVAQLLPIYEILGIFWIFGIIDAYVAAARMRHKQDNP